MFFLKTISTFFRYSTSICNIKNCQNEHFDLLLCEKHFDIYITNAEVNKIQSNVYKYNFSKFEFNDKLLYARNYLIHYITGIHIKYIEHFPLESLFLYHYKSANNSESSDFLIQQFIEDFDFEENSELQYLKTKFKVVDSDKPLRAFISKNDNFKVSKYFVAVSYILTVLYILLIAISPEKFKIPKLSFLFPLLILFSMSWTLNERSLKTLKQIFALAYGNKLFKLKKDNEKFIVSTLPKINKINNREEFIWTNGGATIAIISVTIGKIIYENWDKDFIILILIAISGVMFAIITFNAYCASIYRVLTINSIKYLNQNDIKFDFYDLEKAAGIKELKIFLRSSILHVVLNLAMLIFIVLLVQTKVDLHYNFIHSLIILLLLFELYNIYQILKVARRINLQFKTEIRDEISKLNIMKSTLKFRKADVINKLKLNLFFNATFWSKFIWNFILFLTTYLINKYDQEIIEFIKNVYIN